MVKSTFVPGDLVFAKVKGYPAWPAKITSQAPKSSTFRVFFYGTYETANVKKNDVWPYTQENRDKFGTEVNLKRKGYQEGLEQIENTPEIAGLQDDVMEDSVLGVTDAATPVVIKKPLKIDGEVATPAATSSPRRALKRSAPQEADQKSPAVTKVSRTEAEEASTPSTVSRSGRVIKPKKFGDDSNSQQESGARAADKIIEEPRKVWVKLKSSGDLVEINLDREKPER